MQEHPYRFRNGLAGTLAGLIVITVLLGVLIIGVSRVVTSKETVKSFLGSADVKQQVTATLLAAVSGSAEETPADSEKLNPDIVQPLVDKFFTDENYQQNINSATDSVYEWLEGNQPVPQFSINLTQSPKNFQKELSTTLKTAIAELPACPAGQPVPEEVNPLALQCRPRNYSPRQVDQLLQAPAGSEGSEFLKTGNITAENLNIDPASSQRIQNGYRFLQLAPWYLFIALMLLSGFVLLLVQPKWRGLRYIGTSLSIPAGIWLLIAAVILMRSKPPFTTADAAVTDTTRNVVLGEFLRLLLESMARISSGLVLIGLIFLIVSVFIKRHRPAINPVQ